jgi:hypothetical protein
MTQRSATPQATQARAHGCVLVHGCVQNARPSAHASRSARHWASGPCSNGTTRKGVWQSASAPHVLTSRAEALST